MAKQKTHFEQVPVKLAEKVRSEERKATSSMDTGSKSEIAIVPMEETIAVSAGGMN